MLSLNGYGQISLLLALGAVGPEPSPRGPLAPHLVRMNESTLLDLGLDPGDLDLDLKP